MPKAITASASDEKRMIRMKQIVVIGIGFIYNGLKKDL